MALVSALPGRNWWGGVGRCGAQERYSALDTELVLGTGQHKPEPPVKESPPGREKGRCQNTWVRPERASLKNEYRHKRPDMVPNQC